MYKYKLLSIIVFLKISTVYAIAVHEDGISLQEPGIFVPGCYYDESLSDHAPVLYDSIGTWNIAAPVSTFAIQPNPSQRVYFYNHKFRTDEKGALINRSEENISLLHPQEINNFLLTDTYTTRLRNLLNKIKDIFNSNENLMYIAIQEIAPLDSKFLSGDNIKDFMSQNLENLSGDKLKIYFYEPLSAPLITSISMSTYKKDISPDVALIARDNKSTALIQEFADHDNRMVSWCSIVDKRCYVPTHLPRAANNEEQILRCQDIKNMAVNLRNKKYENITIIGDFNTTVKKLRQSCDDILFIPEGTVTIKTSEGDKANSCGSNQGHVALSNIDILINYDFSNSSH
jgi:hypothetical protein